MREIGQIGRIEPAPSTLSPPLSVAAGERQSISLPGTLVKLLGILTDQI